MDDEPDFYGCAGLIVKLILLILLIGALIRAFQWAF